MTCCDCEVHRVVFDTYHTKLLLARSRLGYHTDSLTRARSPHALVARGRPPYDAVPVLRSGAGDLGRGGFALLGDRRLGAPRFHDPLPVLVEARVLGLAPGPPRALTRRSSAGSEAVRFTATARASRRRSALWLGGTALERFGVSPMNTSAGSVLLRAPKALARNSL